MGTAIDIKSMLALSDLLHVYHDDDIAVILVTMRQDKTLWLFVRWVITCLESVEVMKRIKLHSKRYLNKKNTLLIEVEIINSLLQYYITL